MDKFIPHNATGMAIDNAGQQTMHQMVSVYSAKKASLPVIEYALYCGAVSNIPKNIDILNDSDNYALEVYNDIVHNQNIVDENDTLRKDAYVPTLSFRYAYDPDTYDIQGTEIIPSYGRIKNIYTYKQAQEIIGQNLLSHNNDHHLVELHHFTRRQKELLNDGASLTDERLHIKEVCHQLGLLTQKTASAFAREKNLLCLHKTRDNLPTYISTHQANHNTPLYAPITTTKKGSTAALNSTAFFSALHKGNPEILRPEAWDILAKGANLAQQSKMDNDTPSKTSSRYARPLIYSL